ncbi:hypothetical protein AAG570_009574 [Ranatra chinensis]|uniref:UDENN domain-containing protein n=1 Tax=Ranatra chinensis TaxID=642074 RepID=A0ABD0Z6K6_9HEMI
MDDAVDKQGQNPVLHVLVVGFHHKKGCQVEYSYPPLSPDGSVDSNECPAGWKYLPTLALPDGSHNYDQDTVFFHLPGLNNPNETVFGISCFRQISVEKLKNRTADITRGTVQKSVCVLSSVPLYGHIHVKMDLITHAYFDEGDFTKVSLLEDTYHHLNDCLKQIEDLHVAPQLFVGLSVRDIVLRLRHKALLLYKMMLLERKVLFFHSPVQPLCSTILSLLSLHPGMIERGLYSSACIRPSRPMSPVPNYNGMTSVGTTQIGNEPQVISQEKPLEETKYQSTDLETKLEYVSTTAAIQVVPNGNCVREVECESHGSSEDMSDALNGDITSPKMFNGDGSSSLPRDSSMDMLGDESLQNTLSSIALVDAEKCGLPLDIFNDGYLCLPYLSLPYMDVLTDQNINGYVIGATNVLFKQKKNLADIVVEVESGRVETIDIDLKRALHLSTEDLRFGEFLVRQVSEMRHDNYLDGVGWEGGDEWIRSQFHAYTLCLLRTSLLAEGSKELDQFNKWFMAAWQETNSYKKWLLSSHSQNILEVNPGHPFTGQLSVADMKLRFAHTMQTTEGGRKLNQAMASTSRAVATTGRAVGGALTQAKGALSNWWSNLTSPGDMGQIPSNDISQQESPESIEQGVDAIQSHQVLQV